MANDRFKQADREAFIALGLYAFFFLWWTIFAFGLGSGDPENYSYVFGFPAWFFYSCIAGYPVITILLWVVTRKWFVDMPLDDERSARQKNGNSVSDGSVSDNSVSGGEK